MLQPFHMVLLVSHIAVEEFWSTVLVNIINKFIDGCGDSSLEVPQHHFSQVGVWTLTGPLQHHGSLLFQPFCYRQAVVLGIIVLIILGHTWTDSLTLHSRTPWYTEEFKVDSGTVSWPDPMAIRLAQLFWGFNADMMSLVWTKHATVHYDQKSPLCSRWSENKVKVANLNFAAMFFILEKKDFLLVTLKVTCSIFL